MAFDFKAATPDTTVPDGAFIMGADSQAASDPSLYTIVAMATKLLAVGTAPGSDTQVMFNDGGVLAGDAGLTFNKTTNVLTNTGGKLALSGGTVTVSTPLVDATQTWNDGAVAFTGIKLNVTNTASADSFLMDLQIGGTSNFNVQKVSNGIITNIGNSIAIQQFGSSFYFRTTALSDTSIFASSLALSGGGLSLTANSGAISIGASSDAIITRKAAANLQLGAADGASPVAQTLSTQGNTTTNGNGVSLTIKAGAGDGTGVGGALYLDGGISGAAGTGGAIIFRTAPAAAGGTLATALTIGADKNVAVPTSANFTPTGANTTGFRVGSIALVEYNNSLLISFPGGATNLVQIQSTGSLDLLSGAELGWSSNSATAYSTKDVKLARDAANTLALRNGTNAQEFRVYENTTGTIYKAIKGDRQLIKIAGAAFTDGAAAASGTLTNAPAAGNPTKWIPLDDNGTTRYIPAW